MRLSTPLEVTFQDLKQSIGWMPPVIGVHIRHGDSYVLQKPYLGFESYISALKKEIQRHEQPKPKPDPKPKPNWRRYSDMTEIQILRMAR